LSKKPGTGLEAGAKLLLEPAARLPLYEICSWSIRIVPLSGKIEISATGISVSVALIGALSVVVGAGVAVAACVAVAVDVGSGVPAGVVRVGVADDDDVDVVVALGSAVLTGVGVTAIPTTTPPLMPEPAITPPIGSLKWIPLMPIG
jgi:hypothetical protein